MGSAPFSDQSPDSAPPTSASLGTEAESSTTGHSLGLSDQGESDGTVPDRAVEVSIIIPTCDRPESLRRCLMHVLAQTTSRSYEVLVVDNRPSTPSTAQVLADFPQVIGLSEERAGASYARNLALGHSRGQLIATIDDDVVVPPDWLENLLTPFERPEVWIVTGNLLPLSLEQEAERLFESYCGLGKGDESFEADGDWFKKSKEAVRGWDFGVTANAAYRAELFRDNRVGLLEETLGPGSPVGCGEDPYLFYRSLRAGHTLVYWPAAQAWHEHRQTYEALQQQIYNYSKSAAAYHLTIWLKDGDLRAMRELLFNLPLYYLKRLVMASVGKIDYPAKLAYTELRGFWAGPYSLWQSYRRLAEIGRSEPLTPLK